MQSKRNLLVFAGLLATVGAACSDTSPVEIAVPDAALSSTSVGTPHARNARVLNRLSRSLDGFGAASTVSSSSAFSPAIISNAVIQLGVHPTGELNVPGGQLSSGFDPTTVVGLRFVQTQSDATSPGCLCEGWGVADALTGVTGWANQDYGPATNLEVESFTVTTSTAVSSVLVRNNASGSPPIGATGTPIAMATGAPHMRVVHDYRPSPATQYLYQVTVTVTNLSPNPIDLRYRRVMDWDIAPNTYSEFTTIQGTSGNPVVLRATNNGFLDSNPLSPVWELWPHFEGDFVNAGPYDHGAHFDFGFGLLPPGASRQFITYYGAAPAQAAANLALSQVGAEVYSYGQADIAYVSGGSGPCWPWTPAPFATTPGGMCGAETGAPHTFIFAFRNVGGPPIFNPIDITLNIAPNPISLSRSDLIFVWIPSTADFDATRVIPASATLGNESDPEAPIARRPDNSPWFMVGDFNRDGRMDRALVFRRADLVATGDLTTATTRLVLRASHETLGLIRADGPVRVVP
jgi:hypothetical protein